MSKFATLDEIKHAHDVLLKDQPFFEQDKIDIIECNETKDIKACPGSGKTTTLLAKLIILANQMPLENNQGICVLTHTNVAIEEIKSKLGNKADILFKYPNHFGTIQSFVDKFLAIPYYLQKWNKPIRRIDNDIAYNIIAKEFSYKTYEEKKCIYAQIVDRIPKIIPLGTTKSKIVNSLQLELIKNIWISFDKDLNPLFFRNYGDVKALAKNTETDTYKLFKSTRFASIDKGTLTYDDAYSLSIDYVNKFPELTNVFSNRFKYLFMDEMQDTEKKQLDIIDKVFDKGKTIIQRFGDHHQSIYNSVSDIELWKPVKPLEINNSKRFGENIAKILRTVCIEGNKSLKPNDDIISLNPILIVFDNPTDVLPKYCELLNIKKIGEKTVWEFAEEEKMKDPKKRNNIKAIGWVGKPNNEFNIKSYFREFNGFIKKDKVSYDSLKSFLRKQNKANIKDYSNKIIEALLHILSTANVKYSVGKTSRTYTKTTLLEEFARRDEENANQLRSNLVKWAKDIHNSDAFNDETIVEIRSYIRMLFCPLFGVNIENKYVKSFIDSDGISDISEDEIKNNNVFKSNGVEIEVGTIHSVKGETHIATLYLETSYFGKHESESILEQMKGVAYKTKKNDTHIKETLKMAYVGMSRPKYMLCYAIHSSRNDDALNIENGGMWEVVRINKGIV